MLLLTISNPLLAFIMMSCLCLGFLGGAIWGLSGRSNKEEEKKYWDHMKAVDDAEREMIRSNGRTPSWKKAK